MGLELGHIYLVRRRCFSKKLLLLWGGILGGTSTLLIFLLIATSDGDMARDNFYTILFFAFNGTLVGIMAAYLNSRLLRKV